MKYKKIVYVICTIFLGLLLSFFVHALLEIFLIKRALLDETEISQETNFLGLGCCTLPVWLSCFLFAGGMIGGYCLGKYWWKVVYVERKHWFFGKGRSSRSQRVYKFAVSLLIPQLAGGLGSVFTASSIGNWYNDLAKGPLNPPNWVFGPVWTALFVLMGIALYLVWEKKDRDNVPALVVFGIQLAFNVLWSVFFFGLKNPGLALGEIFLLLLLISLNIFAFWKVDKKAGILLVPYFAWVCFAAYLNFTLWSLN